MDDFDVPLLYPFINKPFNRIDRKAEKNFVDVTWILNQSCPFHCWYCPDSIHRGQNKYYEWEQASKFLDIVFNRYETCHFSLSGGEPTTWPYINQLIDKILSNPNTTVGINSNIIRTQQWWDRITDKLSYVSASYHPSVLTTQEQRDEFFEKCEKISQSCNLGVRLMMDPKHWDHCVDLYYSLRDKYRKYTVEPVRVLDYFDGFNKVKYFDGYNGRQEEILKSLNILYSTDNKFDYKGRQRREFLSVTYDDKTTLDIDHVAPIVLNKKNEFLGWKCNIGIESLYIGPTGDVKRGNCMVGGISGYIHDVDNIVWPKKEPIVCDVQQCHCFTDIKLTKWKD